MQFTQNHPFHPLCSIMTYTVLIPARLASTRLPNKPLADVAGKPLVVRVAERALQSRAADRKSVV